MPPATILAKPLPGRPTRVPGGIRFPGWFLIAGLVVTLNTDDPGISNIRLSDEYFTAVSELGLSEETLKGLILSGAQYSFLPESDKKQLEDQLQVSLGLGMKES